MEKDSLPLAVVVAVAVVAATSRPTTRFGLALGLLLFVLFARTAPGGVIGGGAKRSSGWCGRSSLSIASPRARSKSYLTEVLGELLGVVVLVVVATASLARESSGSESQTFGAPRLPSRPACRGEMHRSFLGGSTVPSVDPRDRYAFSSEESPVLPPEPPAESRGSSTAFRIIALPNPTPRRPCRPLKRAPPGSLDLCQPSFDRESSDATRSTSSIGTPSSSNRSGTARHSHESTPTTFPHATSLANDRTEPPRASHPRNPAPHPVTRASSLPVPRDKTAMGGTLRVPTMAHASTMSSATHDTVPSPPAATNLRSPSRLCWDTRSVSLDMSASRRRMYSSR